MTNKQSTFEGEIEKLIIEGIDFIAGDTEEIVKQIIQEVRKHDLAEIEKFKERRGWSRTVNDRHMDDIRAYMKGEK